ncbi:regulator of nonsense transcripts 2-like [Asterias rubens]|uniref:regulator of nonsense transcripts 2-like n=1 Tax=Asterias rubens TaxID=7604 RepID=UPI001455C189|nr:regulator of nonsense transcripts 2-like [Asterias rubens]XP_033641820.1 regulator of nonsense transcripts 2-like [Asterias rubens]
MKMAANLDSKEGLKEDDNNGEFSVGDKIDGVKDDSISSSQALTEEQGTSENCSQDVVQDVNNPGTSDEHCQGDSSHGAEAKIDETLKDAIIDDVVAVSKEPVSENAPLKAEDGESNHLMDAQKEPLEEAVSSDDLATPILQSDTSKELSYNVSIENVSESPQLDTMNPNESISNAEAELTDDKNETESTLIEQEDTKKTVETSKASMQGDTQDSPQNSGSSKLSSGDGADQMVPTLVSERDTNETGHVKGQCGDGGANVDSADDVKVITESVKSLVILPNPAPEETEKVSTTEKGDVRAKSVQDTANLNNNAKGQSSTSESKTEAKSTSSTSRQESSKTSSAKQDAPSQDSARDRAGKSYSAQRVANRGTRGKGAASPDPKTPTKQEAPKPIDGRARSDSAKEKVVLTTKEKAILPEDAVKAKDKGKHASEHGREKTSGRSRDGDREAERRITDRRRDKDRRPSDPAPVIKKPVKTKEELEKEEAERKRRDEEQKKIEMEKKEAEIKRQEEEEQRLLEESNAKLAEEEQKQAFEIAAEAVQRKEAKLRLRAKNLAAAAERPDESFFMKLDSSMKKNSTFVRKLKTLTEQQRDSLTAEFNSLNLTKYVGEVATAIVESKFKMADISCAVHICSLVHQRYAEFSAHLQQAIQKCHPAQAKKEDSKETKKEPVLFDSRIRVELRFLAELIVGGVFTEKEGLPSLNTLLSSVLKADKENHTHISIISSFLKHCGEDYAGIVPRRNRILADKFNLTLPVSEIFSAQRKNAYKGLLKEHYLSLTKHLLKEHRDLQSVEKQNRRILQTKGELSEERRKRYNEIQASYQKLLVNTSHYADLIDEVMPDLPEAEISPEEREMMALDFMTADHSKAEFDFETSLWEDEDTRTFHENLIDLRTMVPGILFKDSEKKGSPDEKQEELAQLGEDIVALEQTDDTEVVTTEEAEAAEMAPNEEQEVTTEDEIIVEEVESTSEPDLDDTEEEEEEHDKTTNMSKKILLDTFLQRLPQCVNRDFIDKAAVEFCMDLNTKINRRKLIKALFNVPRTRLDLLSFYSRLVATLYPCMPDIGTELVEKLKADFRWHVRKKDQMMIETKIKTVRFIGELTKFKMCSKSDTLQCVKILLQDFRHHNIDMVCNLLDSCGRFLYRSQDSHLLTKALLELMMRKRNKLHLIERHSTMVENTFFYCNPPEVKQAVMKERPILHEYVRKLIYRDLSKTTTEKVLKQLRKMDWNNVEIKMYITKCLSSVWNVKFNNVHCVASLLAGLVPYHDDVGIQVVDAVLEDVRIGMEINHAKYNQRRVSMVKFLGELYNYRMVESAVIFKTLYSVIRFGISLDGAYNPLDPPEHLFRLRLVCTLLDTCGQFFDRGTSKKKLDCFLVYFQQYIMYKRSLPIWNPQLPFPLDVDNALADTLETLRPKLLIYSTLDEASEAVTELEKEQVQKLGAVLPMALASVNGQQQGSHSLGMITEGDENKTTNPTEPAVDFTSINEDEEISDSDSEADGVSRRGMQHTGEGHTNNSQSQGQSQNTGDEEGLDIDDHMALDSAGETEDDDTVTMLTGGPKFIKCDEDEDFTTEFDKMLSDSVQQRTVEAVKVPQQDIAIPAHARPRPKKATFDIFHPDSQEEEEEEEQATSVNFVLMMRRGNKQHYHEFEVPKSSELAANLRNREQLALAEKKRLKELTLNINDRQEEEDYQEMMSQIQKPPIPVPVVTKERKSKFHHPKGAPDADQIFNSYGNRKW